MLLIADQNVDIADRAHNTERLTLEAAAADANADYNNALAVAPSSSILSNAIIALNIAEQAYNEAAAAKTAAQADATTAASATAAAQTVYDTKNDTYTTKYREVYGYVGVNTGNPDADDYEAPIIGTVHALTAAQNALTAAIASEASAQLAFEDDSDDAALAGALVAADAALAAALVAATAADAANNQALQDQNNALIARNNSQTDLSDAQIALNDANQVLVAANAAATDAQTAQTVATATKIAAQSISDASASSVAPLLAAKIFADTAVATKGAERFPDLDGLDINGHNLAVLQARRTNAVLTDPN